MVANVSWTPAAMMRS